MGIILVDGKKIGNGCCFFLHNCYNRGEMIKKETGNIVVLILIIGAIVAFSLFSGNDNSSNDTEGYNYPSRTGSSIESEKIIDRSDAVYEHWDEIKDYLNGTETINACSFESGNCYDLDAEISDGQIEMISFPNGGYLYFSADIDEYGNASDIDNDGNSWDFTLDMDSSVVDDAISDWASDNGYGVE